MIQLLVPLLVLVSFAPLAFGADVPGGQVRTATELPANTYELVVSPAYVVEPGGAYLSSKLRYQPYEELGIGVGFGAGEVGFNFGFDAMVHLFPQTASQPAVALLTGFYFNRFESSNFLVARFTPITSYSFKTNFGRLTPYAGFHIAPSFRLGNVGNELSLKSSLGSVLTLKEWGGMQTWYELGWGLLNSNYEVVFGISYPFTAL